MFPSPPKIRINRKDIVLVCLKCMYKILVALKRITINLNKSSLPSILSVLCLYIITKDEEKMILFTTDMMRRPSLHNSIKKIKYKKRVAEDVW